MEVASSLSEAMFHDIVMWVAFFFIYAIKLYKPSITLKIVLLIIGIFSLITLQFLKSDYRDNVWRNNMAGDISTFRNVFENAEAGTILDESAAFSFINRVNQGWIFASTVNNMETTKDFAQSKLIKAYLEAAFLPRVLAPNKLKAGSRELFNEYSGTYIAEGTSMSLGILADGYISYGAFGVYLFAFSFGLAFCIVFKIVENWTEVSPFFFLFIFPILHYAVRPDCETQTLLGHMIKGLLLYGILVWYYKGYFKKRILLLSKEEARKIRLKNLFG
jgi:hypothetical protein